METKKIEEIQKIEFEILKFIKSSCEKLNIHYYLAYGTLIGAIRHNGFIPWDDDIDIHMKREDYVVFLEYMKKNPHPYYKLISYETDENFTAPLPKVIDSRFELIQDYGFVEKVPLGPYVDIFILDGAGDTINEAKKTYNEAYSIYRKWMRAATQTFSNKKRMRSLLLGIKHIPEKIRGINYWLKKIDDFCTLKSVCSSKYIGALSAGTPNPLENIWKKEDFGEGKLVRFNSELFTIPVNYDVVLKSGYGDYMTLPKEKYRISHHKYTLKMKKR